MKTPFVKLWVLASLFLAYASTASASTPLGIGIVLDSATSLNRSFALFELMKKNVLVHDGDTLKPELADYPAAYPFAITGIFNSADAEFRIYHRGKKIKEIKTDLSWKGIYQMIAAEFAAFGYKPGKKVSLVSEGNPRKLGEKGIGECMPGSILIEIPSSNLSDKLKDNFNLRFDYKTESYASVREVYGQYSTYKENDIFFFRNNDVPTDLQRAVKPLVYPTYYSPAPSLTYLAEGVNLRDRDAGAALNSLYAALYASNQLLASPFEKALIRNLAFAEISSLHRKFPKRANMAELFELGARLNEVYINSPEAQQKRTEYYDAIQKVKDMAVPAENKAREIRGTKRMGAFLASVSTAGAIATVSPYDNSVSDAMLDQATTTLTEYSTQASDASSLLQQQFVNIDQQINSASFVAGEETQTAIGKPFIAAETYVFLKTNPALIRNILFDYASSKPTLKRLIESYYDAAESDRDAVLNKLFAHLAEIEAITVNVEVRGKELSEKIRSNF